MEPNDFFQCNRNGKGFRVRRKIVTTFEERVLFLRNSSNHETDEKSSAPKVGSRRPAKLKKRASSAFGIKRKDTKTEDDDFRNETESKVKRTKNESKYVKNSIKDDVEASVEESLFSNDLLLRTIFASLNVEDLKLCRRVNSLWNFEATKILLKHDCLKAIKISSHNVAIRDTAEFKLPTELQDFRNIVTNSKLFPSTFFAVNNHKLTSETVGFFRENGHLVKTFCFEPDQPMEIQEDDATAGDILLLVAACFPNLTTLKFVHAFEEPTPAVILLAIEHVPDFKNLHTLELTNFFPADVVSLILTKARNLQNIYLHAFEDYDYPGDLDKLLKVENVIPRLKNIYLFFSSDALEVYQKVLKKKPRFSCIGAIHMDTYKSLDLADAGRFLTALFHQCSESLTEILDVRCLQVFDRLNFPVFPNVKRLGIQLQSLTSGVNLAKVLPNLTTIEFEFWDEDEPQKISPESLSPFLSVRHVLVKWGDRYISDKWAKKICSLVPKVTSARFFNPLSDSAYEYVWKLSALQDLLLNIGTKPRENLFSALDSAFTGFTVGMAKQLYRIDAADFSLSAKEAESARIKPSIIDLKELRTLSLRLFDATVKDDNNFVSNDEETFGQNNVEVIFDPGEGKALLQVDGKIILSCVSKRFGFDLCPHLRSNVSVGFTHYVNIDTQENDSD